MTPNGVEKYDGAFARACAFALPEIEAATRLHANVATKRLKTFMTDQLFPVPGSHKA
jgi:hypothetical protein